MGIPSFSNGRQLVNYHILNAFTTDVLPSSKNQFRIIY